APTLIRTATSCTSPGRRGSHLKVAGKLSGRQRRWHLLLREPGGHFLRRHLQWYGAIALSWLPPETAKLYLNRGQLLSVSHIVVDPKDPSTSMRRVFRSSTKTEQKAIVQPTHFFTGA